MKKLCYRCNRELELIQFYKDDNRKDKLQPYCKCCTKELYIKNRIRLLKQAKIYYEKYKSKIIERCRIYRQENKVKIAEKDKERCRKNRKQTNKRRMLRRKIDINFKIRCNLGTRIWDSLKHNYKSASTLKLIGCPIGFLKKHLESQFKLGMSWNNYGKWHIDHIIPCASFDLSKSEEQQKCFNWTNLQPLWAEDNLSKSDKITLGGKTRE